MKIENKHFRFRMDIRKSILNLAIPLFTALLMSSTLAHAIEGGSPIRPGFDVNTLAPNDDGSTGLVGLGFGINFFGNTFSQGFVNNNGNMTFDGPLGTYTPFGLADTNQIIIAPFFADVDTSVTGSSPVTYGQGTIGSRPAFGVNWINVTCYSTIDGGFNSFQMVLIDRSDIGAGDFDIEFNYQQIDWETGTASSGNSVCEGGNSARVGYSNGTTASFELAGSGVPGAFLDTNLDTGLIHNNRNSLEPGRYVFEVRNGGAPIGNHIAGTIFGNDADHPLASALVQICTTGQADLQCNLTRTNASGQYHIDGLNAVSYEVKAFPPAGTNFNTGVIGPIELAGTDLDGQDIILLGPQPLPNNTSVSPSRVNTGSGEPIIYWHDTLNLATQGCSGGAASYTITNSDTGSVITNGNLQEDSNNPGNYSGEIAPLYPNHGHVTVAIQISCPDGSQEDIVFSMYIDPSGIVKDTLGNPISGATVTLYRSDSSAGPFEQVPDGSDVMSPTNRTNPDLTNDQGLFGWDVVTGFYKVRAEKAGCVSPLDSNQGYVETGVLPIPPEVTDLELVLDCALQTFDVCDINHDNVVTRTDINLIYGTLRSVVEPGTSGDLTGDGRITTQDVRGCILQCTLPNCAEIPN